MAKQIARIPDHQDPVTVTVTTGEGRHYQVALKAGATFPITDDVVQQHAWAFQIIEVVEEATAEPGRKRTVKRKPAPVADDAPAS